MFDFINWFFEGEDAVFAGIITVILLVGGAFFIHVSYQDRCARMGGTWRSMGLDSDGLPVRACTKNGFVVSPERP